MAQASYKKYTWYFLGSILLLFIIGFMFLSYDTFSASDVSFYNWMSFYKEMPREIVKNKKIFNVDFAFVGSSRTRYFVDPYFFKKHHVSVLNAGVDGLYYPSFPGVLKQLYALHPKVIVLSINMTDLTSPDWDFDRPLRVEDVFYFMRHNPSVFLDKKFYKKIMPGPLLFFMIGRIRGQDYKWNMGTIDCSPYANDAYLKKLVLPKKSLTTPGKVQYVKGCRDVFGGVLLRQLDQQPTSHIVPYIVPYKELNKKKVKYFQSLIRDIDKRGIIPVLVLQGKVGYSYKVDMDYLQKTFGSAFVINMTNVFTKASDFPFWADVNHVNVKGRYLYTKALYKALRPVMNIIPYHQMFVKGPKRKGEVL